MAQMIDTVITGASGRMGQMLIRSVMDHPEFNLIGGVVPAGDPWDGQDIGTAMGTAAIGITASSDAVAQFAKARAVIDFTAPEATVEYGDLAAQARCVHVIGTTGFAPDHLERLEWAANHAVQIRAGNMSLGVNLLTQLTRQVSAALGLEYDIEIVESHHRHKVDAPSGTALMLGEAAAQGRGVALADVARDGRSGITGARPEGEIGFHAIRGGDVVGEHDVIFAGPGERITLRHVASDRSVFANGALRAALWGAGQEPGAYDMIDVLGLR